MQIVGIDAVAVVYGDLMSGTSLGGEDGEDDHSIGGGEHIGALGSEYVHTVMIGAQKAAKVTLTVLFGIFQGMEVAVGDREDEVNVPIEFIQGKGVGIGQGGQMKFSVGADIIELYHIISRPSGDGDCKRKR